MRSLQKASRILSCGIYRTGAPGLEVRAGYSDEDLLRSQRAAEIGSVLTATKRAQSCVIKPTIRTYDRSDRSPGGHAR